MESRVSDTPVEEEEIEDDRLRLIFTCCHPALPPEGQVALTLREICGLTTEEIARAFLVTPAALAQRVVRAKTKIRETRIPRELPRRMDAVLQVIYLVFNEGYSAAAGAEVTRGELTGEAIRLGRLLTELHAEPEAMGPEVMGLLALMLLQESRRAARTSPAGELILLENQDRSLWNQGQIAEGVALVERALKSRRFGPYTLQAAIAAVHAEAESTAATAVRPVGTDAAFAGGLSQPGRGHCHAGWSGGRSGGDRRGPRAGRVSQLLPGACSARRYVPQAGQDP